MPLGIHPALETRVLTGVARRFSNPIMEFKNILFPKRPYQTYTIEWEVMDRPRTLAPIIAGTGTTGLQAAGTTREKHTWATAHTRQWDTIPGIDMKTLRRPGGTETEPYGQQAVTDRLSDMAQQAELLEEYMCAQALTGTISVTDAESGGTITISYNFLSAHTPTVGTTWATASTDIITDIETYVQRVVNNCGLMPDYLFIPPVVKGYLINNTGIRTYIAQRFGTQGTVVEAVQELFDGLRIIVHRGSYTTAAGTVTNFLDSDNVVFAVDPAKAEAATGLPSTFMALAPSEDVEAAVTSPGRFSKSWETKNPSGVNVLLDEQFIPLIPTPNAILYADVVP